MDTPISILIIEEFGNGIKPIEKELNHHGVNAETHIVDTEERLKSALHSQEWNLVLSAYQISNLDAPSSLQIIRQKGLTLPFIIVTDSSTEEAAITAMNNGAQDVVLKNNLGRLVPAIKRELENADIQKRYRQQKKLAEKIALNSQYKSEFLANISHELRTTLNSIQLLSKLLTINEDGNLNEKELEYADIINSSSSSLLELINEVLDLSEIESGKMNILLGKVNPHAIGQKIERQFLPQAKQKNLSFEYLQLDSETEAIHTDKVRVQQVLKNLISNSLKFTESGRINIRLYTPPPSELESLSLHTSKGIAFQVTDTGIGIPKEKQEIIFESFRQAEDTTYRKYGGTGLGLTICKEITDILGGELKLESEPGKGSVFTLYLPVDSTNAVKHYAKHGKVNLTIERQIRTIQDFKAVKENSHTKKKIKGNVLLVDDSIRHNLALKEFLEFKIEKCITAASANEAFKLLTANQINCIVLDMHLPDADGYEVMQHIKKKDEFADLPIIIYTGKDIKRQEENKLLEYAEALVYKNVDSYKVLMNKITSILFNHQQ